MGMRARNGHIFLICLFSLTGAGLTQSEGFYKDLFLDGGVELYSRDEFFAADSLGLSWEYLATEDTDLQEQVLIGEAIDLNGRLLYPDGAPRYRMLYTNGGQSSSHGESLGETGLQRVRTFFAQGGSYGGSCAGAFISSLHWEAEGINPDYYHIWPGRCWRTHLFDTDTDHDIPDSSPLLAYHGFGPHNRVHHVYHTGGCAADEFIDWPQGTEVLARFHYPPDDDIDGRCSAWAFKAADTSGRIVVIGSHPEFEDDGEGLDLMKAMLQYALEGVAEPRLKADLVSGEPRTMDRGWEDDDPAYTRIGDRQIHHFRIPVPLGTDTLVISLDGEAGYDFRLYANPGTYALPSLAQACAIAEGDDQLLVVPLPVAGDWYIAVELATTVNVAGQIYFSNLAVLNGLAYTLTATADSSGAVTLAESITLPHRFSLSAAPNPFNPVTQLSFTLEQAGFVTLRVHDLRGRTVKRLVSDGWLPTGVHRVAWDGMDEDGRSVPAGVYVAALTRSRHQECLKLLLLK